MNVGRVPQSFQWLNAWKAAECQYQPIDSCLLGRYPRVLPQAISELL